MKKILSIIIITCIALSTCALCSCKSAEENIVGTWTNQTTVFGVVTENSYTFNEDGTGKSTTVLGVGLGFDYTIDGDMLTLKYSVFGIEASTKNYTFKISGDKLTLNDGDETVTYTKKDS
ncbi:MAG: hypothetical protein IKT65_07755 [Clostridia bacterium]|nr:hypothetical protein [Clostridia bacterium]